MRRFLASPVLLLALLAAGLSAPADAEHPGRATDTQAAAPVLRVSRVVTGLDVPWDVQPIGKSQLLITERASKRLLIRAGGRTRSVSYARSIVWQSGETGLMSLAIDKGFAKNRRFYMCHGGYKTGGGHDVRVTAFTLDKTGTKATRASTLISGIQATSGRHGGCRLLIQASGALLVGTGDAAVGTNPQKTTSLNGKVLRLSPRTGAPWSTNPYIRSQYRARRYVMTYGHRNVQGLAQRADGSLWSVEHGSYRDDEVNRLASGGNYGWNPVPGYDESVPMTDQSLPGTQIDARWSSGDPTLATSGAVFVSGSRWGTLNGTLAVAALKAGRVLFMKFNAAGELQTVATPAALQRYGRLRSVTRATNGDLWITTANGGSDAVLRVSPS